MGNGYCVYYYSRINRMKSFVSYFNKKTFTSQNLSLVNPHTQWLFLLRVFGLIGAGLFVFSIYLLYQIKNDQVFQVSNPIQAKVLSVNEKSLKKVTEIFNQKKARFFEVKNTPPKYQDPSL